MSSPLKRPFFAPFLPPSSTRIVIIVERRQRLASTTKNTTPFFFLEVSWVLFFNHSTDRGTVLFWTEGGRGRGGERISNGGGGDFMRGTFMNKTRSVIVVIGGNG